MNPAPAEAAGPEFESNGLDDQLFSDVEPAVAPHPVCGRIDILAALHPCKAACGVRSRDLGGLDVGGAALARYRGGAPSQVDVWVLPPEYGTQRETGRRVAGTLGASAFAIEAARSPASPTTPGAPSC
jgi:hypothetical protein